MYFYRETGEIVKILVFNADKRIGACLYFNKNGDLHSDSWMNAIC